MRLNIAAPTMPPRSWASAVCRGQVPAWAATRKLCIVCCAALGFRGRDRAADEVGHHATGRDRPQRGLRDGGESPDRGPVGLAQDARSDEDERGGDGDAGQGGADWRRERDPMDGAEGRHRGDRRHQQRRATRRRAQGAHEAGERTSARVAPPATRSAAAMPDSAGPVIADASAAPSPIEVAIRAPMRRPLPRPSGLSGARARAARAPSASAPART